MATYDHLGRPVPLRRNGYNRNSRRPQVALSYQARATGNNSKHVRLHTTVSSPFPPFVQSFATYNALSSDKTSNIFTAHLPLARNVRIVHYSPFCLQIMWTFPYKRQCVWGIRLPQRGYNWHQASLHQFTKWQMNMNRRKRVGVH